MTYCSPTLTICRYALLTLFTGLVACQSPENSQKIPIPQATTSVEWWPPCNVELQLPAFISRFNQSEGCIPLLSDQSGAWVERDTQRRFSISSEVLSIPSWHEGQRPLRFYPISTPADMAVMLSQGLTQLERVGVLLQAAAWWSLDINRNSIYDAKSPVMALALGNNTIHFDSNHNNNEPAPVHRFSAGYPVNSCEMALADSRLLPPPPHKESHLSFFVELSAMVDVSTVRLVKHWISLDGRIHKRQWPLEPEQNQTLPCIHIKDNDFNPVHTSVWYLESVNQWATSPIWYTPLKG